MFALLTTKMVLKDLNREDITISKNSRWFVGRLRGGYVLIFNWEDVIRTRVEFASTSFELGDKVVGQIELPSIDISPTRRQNG